MTTLESYVEQRSILMGYQRQHNDEVLAAIIAADDKVLANKKYIRSIVESALFRLDAEAIAAYGDAYLEAVK